MSGTVAFPRYSALPGQSARPGARRHRRVRALRVLLAGVSDVSHARGRERQPARAHRADALAARGHAPADDETCGRTSSAALAAAPARPRVRPAFRTGNCSRRRARRSRERPNPLVARAILSVFARQSLIRSRCSAAALRARSRCSHCFARLPGRIGFSMAMSSPTRSPLPARRAPPPRDGNARHVALLTGA